jgi:glycosyltransferase involved in cell wall biosynthesis
VRELTAPPFHLVVADDGSTDETTALCARQNVTCITGKNMGIAWNKNRALFFLDRIMECDVIILLEDDSYPNNFGWQANWVEGAERWGHANFAVEPLRADFLSGEGSVVHPYVSSSVSGQCAAFSHSALSVCGYLDSRFKGYGYEHAEHSARLVRSGFGGEMKISKRGEEDPHFYLLAADLSVSPVESYRDEDSLDANWLAWTKMYGDPTYRHPWRTRAEFRQFRCEINTATRQTDFSLARRLMLAAKWNRWRRAIGSFPTR